MVAFFEFLTNFYLIVCTSWLIDLLDKVRVVKSSISTKTAIFGARSLLCLSIICNQLLTHVEIFHVAFVILHGETLADHPLLGLGVLGWVDVLGARSSLVILQSLKQLLHRPSRLLHRARQSAYQTCATLQWPVTVKTATSSVLLRNTVLEVLIHASRVFAELPEVVLLVCKHLLLRLLVTRSLKASLIILLEVAVKRTRCENVRRGPTQKHLSLYKPNNLITCYIIYPKLKQSKRAMH